MPHPEIFTRLNVTSGAARIQPCREKAPARDLLRQVFRESVIWIKYKATYRVVLASVRGRAFPKGDELRLTTRTNLAMRTLMTCAVNDDQIVRRADIAQACNASENHLAQVVHLLAQHGLVQTTRGRGGGLTLKRRPEEISIGAVFRTFEAGVPFAECFAGAENTCPLFGSCRLRDALSRAVEGFYAELDKLTLADLVVGNCGLESILSVAPVPCGGPRAPVPA